MTQLLPAHIRRLKAAGYSPRTIDSRQAILAAADRQLPYGLDRALPEELEAWMATAGWSANTRCIYYWHITSFYRSEVGAGHLTWDPSTGLERPRASEADPNPVTDDELRLAMDRSDAWWQLAIVLASYAGLRASEIARARREHITDDTLTVRGKGNKTKLLPTHPEIWRRVSHAPPGLLLPRPDGTQYQDLSARARYHFDWIGMPTVHLHRFRAWYATSLLMLGNDIVTVRDLMRHKSIKTTEVYLKPGNGQRRLAISSLPVPNGPQQEAA